MKSLVAAMLPTVAVSVLIAAAAQCGGGSPANPSPKPPSVVLVAVTGAQAGSSFQCTATANFSDGTTQNVTTQAQWETSDAAVATVSSTGLVTPVGMGDVDVRATYLGMSGTLRYSATLNAPTPAPDVRYAVSGVVSDTSNSRPVTGVRVEAVDNANTGKASATDGSGSYRIADLVPGAIVLRFTRDVYQTLERPITLGADVRADVMMRPLMPVIVIRSDAADPKDLIVFAGDRVTFINQDDRVHRIFSDPHSSHLDCPPINEVGYLVPGQIRTTAVLTAVRACGYHDHGEPDNQALRGTITIR